MPFLEKHKALVIAVLTVSIFTVGLLSLKFSANDNLPNSIMYNLNFEEVEELENFFEELRDPIENIDIETHSAFNEAEKAAESDLTNTSSEESGRKNETSNQKSVDDQIFEELANEPDLIAILDNNARIAAANVSKAPTPKPKKEKSYAGDDTSKEIAFKNTANRSSSMYFHLSGRNMIDIPNPIYTCEKPGKIVVNIVVNAIGIVVNTSINQASSTSNDGCLLDNALQYAALASFSASDLQSQSGTITYIFPGQGRN